MRGLVFKVWQRVGDVVLGAAGRGARLMDTGAEVGGTRVRQRACPVVLGRSIRPAFEVIEGGKGTLPGGSTGSRPPQAPVLPSRRAS